MFRILRLLERIPWTGPVSLNALKSWDPSHPNYPYGGTGVGTIHVTARLFRGELADIGTGNVDFCGIDDIIAVNAANLPPIGLCGRLMTISL